MQPTNGEIHVRTEERPVGETTSEGLEWWTEPSPLVSAHATLRLFRALIARYLERRANPKDPNAGHLRTRIA